MNLFVSEKKYAYYVFFTLKGLKEVVYFFNFKILGYANA